MTKKLKNYFKQRRERRLREKAMFCFGTQQTTGAISAWVEFVESGKITSEILLSAAEQLRMEELRKLEVSALTKQ